ncbi:MAG TPA: CmcJ/NvfI family oxidoreductase [Acidimicrobiales bacterium]|nr:CmcJ/NvfI family oxidoreductase [Acidimicrobiales bacterium]
MKTFCRATLNYVPAEGGPGAPHPAIDVEILDGRRAGLPGWEECGFELVRHPSAVEEWTDDEEIERVHHPEVEELARAMTGATVALVPSHIKRSPERAREHGDLSPITFVHSDFAAGYDTNIRDMYRNPSDGAARALERNGITPGDVDRASRIVILQLWRNLGATKMDFPLAFCDARTVGVDEGRAFLVTNYADTGATFEAIGVVAPGDGKAHRWYAFPELTVDEAVAFRTYDTDLVARGATYFTPHSAFRDPDVPVGRPARSSIELRATCLFL